VACYSAFGLIALRSPCCAQARGVHSVYTRSTHASHPCGADLKVVLLGALHLVLRYAQDHRDVEPGVQTLPSGHVCVVEAT
jgi:hypothetical protein